MTERIVLNKTIKDDDTRSREIFDKSDLIKTNPYKKFLKLIKKNGLTISKPNGIAIKQLSSEDFETKEQKIGLALIANYFFKTDMGLAGISVIDNVQGKINICIKNGIPIAFIGEKTYTDPDNRSIYYLDIAGVDPELEGKGLTKTVCKECIKNYLEKSGKDTVVVSRTQNPMLIGMLKNSLPSGSLFFPFDQVPNEKWKKSVNWLIGTGEISRNERSDSFFDSNQSLIYWGAYGKYGDGTTWENMTKQFDIDWNRSNGIMVKKYLEKNGSTLEEALKKGHALVIGSYIAK